MKLHTTVTLLAVLVGCWPAFALKAFSKVTPKWTKESGITVQTEKRDDGSISFTVTRYLDEKPKYPADSDFMVKRTAFLKIGTPYGDMARTNVAAEEKKGTLVYWFSLSRVAVPHSTFTLSEYDDYKDTEKREHLIGGGSIYEFDLAEFAAPHMKPKLPDHP